MSNVSLFEPTKLGKLELPNKLVVPPMCTWLSSSTNEATDANLVHYGALAMGGFGLIILEASPVEHRGRLQPNDLGIYDDTFVGGLRRITDYIHANSPAKVAIQIGHGGRKGPLEDCFSRVPRQLGPNDPCGSQPISSSATPFSEHYLTPKMMSRDDMLEVKAAFVAAARRAVAANFDAIEIHGAHGYLLCQFTSPAMNERTDEYGGSLENRMRFPLEVIGAVRAAIPAEMPLIVRISASDWVEGGFTPEEAVVYSKEMKKIGVDCVHVSSGGASAKQNVIVGWNYQIPFCEKILKEADIQTIAVGGITTADHAEEILKAGQASLIAVGRAALRDPYWPRKEAEKMGVQVWYPTYQRPAYMSIRKLASA